MPPDVQRFLAGVTLADVLTWLGVFGAGFAAVKWVIPFARKLSHFIDDVMGEPARAGMPARPGIMARLESIEARQTTQGETLEVVRHELFPNSGKSLRDQTNRIEQKVNVDDQRIVALSEQVGDVEGTVTELSDRVEDHITQADTILRTLQAKDEQ